MTPLFRAVCGKKTEAVKLLLERGANVHHKAKKDYTPLHHAACSGNIEMVEALLNAGADIESQSHIGMTPLFRAVYNENTEIMKFLLEKGADVHHAGCLGRSLMHSVVSLSDAKSKTLAETAIEKIKVLLDYGADINVKDNSGKTPLALVVDTANVDIKRTLIRNGARR